MKLQRLLFALTGVNLVLLAFLLAETRQVSAQDVAPVLRGRALEIVDGNGTVRAGITIYSDLVVFRLHDQRGKPTVKLDTHEDGPRVKKGSGLGLLGNSDDTQAFIGTEGPVAKMGLKNGDGKRQGMEP